MNFKILEAVLLFIFKTFFNIYLLIYPWIPSSFCVLLFILVFTTIEIKSLNSFYFWDIGIHIQLTDYAISKVLDLAAKEVIACLIEKLKHISFSHITFTYFCFDPPSLTLGKTIKLFSIFNFKNIFLSQYYMCTQSMIRLQRLIKRF